ncbi:hypothetical protein NDU88_007035 [Pleurodeles waltl]|uniref:Uncharacterized protein n=1 Tax=Pleurodeles waltl TaxID=8319 RepID=A0AAV7WE93_PLEWA|nr:hypothetical protein NDU88_007035 [Pleurodeles waltl]
MPGLEGRKRIGCRVSGAVSRAQQRRPGRVAGCVDRAAALWAPPLLLFLGGAAPALLCWYGRVRSGSAEYWAPLRA